MGRLGGPTPKRHWLWANADILEKLENAAGTMTKEDKSKCKGPSLVRRYIDKNGKKRVVGTEHLKSSQSLCLSILGLNINFTHKLSLRTQVTLSPWLDVEMLGCHV